MWSQQSYDMENKESLSLQGIHALDFAMTRFAEGKPVGTSKRFVATLDDERAIDLAGKFVSEGFVLAVRCQSLIIASSASQQDLTAMLLAQEQISGQKKGCITWKGSCDMHDSKSYYRFVWL